MNELILNQSKILKLSNILIKTLQEGETETYFLEIEKMQNYIKTKGAMQIGPLIHYTKVFVNENGKLSMEIKILLQSNNFIHNVEPPYQMESLIRVKFYS